jgi:hypothetical protein
MRNMYSGGTGGENENVGDFGDDELWNSWWFVNYILRSYFFLPFTIGICKHFCDILLYIKLLYL